MDKEPTRLEIKAMTSDLLTTFCARYGAAGIDNKGSSCVAHWGCFSTDSELLPQISPDVLEIRNKLKKEYRIKVIIISPSIRSIDIHNIDEKTFRQLLVTYDIRYNRYNYKNKTGRFTFIG